MARTPIANDGFNRAALGTTDWAQTNVDNGNIAIDASVNFYGEAQQPAGNRQSARWIGTGTFTSDQYSEITIAGAFSFLSTDFGIGVCARMSADTVGARDHYSAFVCANGNGPNYATQFGIVSNGAYTSFNSADIPWVVGDKISIECEGSTIRFCKNGVPIGGLFTTTDSTLTGGVPGIQGAGGNITLKGDDWVGGNISAPLPAGAETSYSPGGMQPQTSPTTISKW